MNYFGTSKRVKVEQGVTPRDFDRSNLFTQVPPVIIDEELTGIYILTMNTIFLNANTRSTLTHLLGVYVKEYKEVPYKFKIYIKIEATEKQVKLIRLIKGFKHIKEIK